MSRRADAIRCGAASAAPQRFQPRLRRLRLTVLAPVLVTGLVLASSAASARAAPAQPDRDPLCAIVPPLDEILRCADGQGVASEPAPSQAPKGSTAQGAAVSAQGEPPPVVPPTPRFVDNLLLVRIRRDVSERDRENLLARAGVTAVRRIPHLGVIVVRMPPPHRDAALAELRTSNLVAHAERDAVMKQLDTVPNDTNWSAQWGLRQADFPVAWDRTRGLASVSVAVLDTGVNSQLPDLHNVAGGYNIVSPASAAVDDNGHGTSVAGIIAARTDNHEGIAGVCWACSILPIKVLDADGTGDTAVVAAGIVKAADAGARVISMSLGGPADDATLDQAVAYAVSKGAILVAAAGNNGSATPFYPAAIQGVIGVAAADESDHPYPWSNVGGWVQVAAPGCNPAPSSAGGYVVFCGTSSATPLVAGLAALLLSEQPGASRAAIVDAIEQTAVPIGDSVRYGRIDAAAAVAALADASSGVAVNSAPATKQVAIAELRGRLTRRAPVWAYRRSLDPMLVTATLRFGARRILSLSLLDEKGRLLARASGRGPLRVTRRVRGGTFAFRVEGRRTPASFELVLTGLPNGGTGA